MKSKKDYTIVLDLNQDEVPAIINLTDGTVKPVPKRKNIYLMIVCCLIPAINL